MLHNQTQALTCRCKLHGPCNYSTVLFFLCTVWDALHPLSGSLGLPIECLIVCDGIACRYDKMDAIAGQWSPGHPDTHFYAPSFKEVEEAYWFGPLHGAWCVVPALCFAYGQELLEIGSWNLICGISLKNKRTHIFFLFHQTFCCRVMPFFRRVFYFAILSLWNFVNKVSGEPLELGSWYLAHRLCPRCRWPD